MQRLKTREEIVTQPFVNKADIQKLFLVGYSTATKIYQAANQLDDDQLGIYRIEPTKVRITSVCKVSGVSLNTLQKQIKSGSSAKHTAMSV